MKNYSRTLIFEFAAALTLAAAVPLATSAADSDGGHVSEWFTDEQGRIFYYDNLGVAVTGEQEIDGEWYLFSDNGVQKTGWRTVGGTRRYYDSETGKPVYGWLEYCGKQYYIENDTHNKLTDCITENDNGDKVMLDEKGSMMIDSGLTEFDGDFYFVGEDGSLATGEIEINDIPYVFDDDGICQTSWVTVGEKVYYYNPETAEPAFGLFELDGSYYYIDKDNGMCTSVAEIDGVEYLFNENNGKMEFGWIDINENTHYFYNDGTYASGIVEIGGSTYVFSNKGILLKGLQNVGGKIYYSGDDGKLMQGKINVGDDVYYFGDDFSAQSGLYEFDGETYYFADNGIMQKGWITAGEKTFYFSEDGTAVSGLVEIDGKYYCFDTVEKYMRTGRLIVNGNKYYFAEDGTMQYGLQEIDGKTYYFDSDGVMTTGLQIIYERKYYFADDGSMQYGWITATENEQERKFYFSEDGSAVSGIVEIDGKYYCFDIAGKYMRTGRLLVNGNKYYFAEDGTMQYGLQEIDGKTYYFGSDGIMLTGLQEINGESYYFNDESGYMEKNKVINNSIALADDGRVVAFSDVQQKAKGIISSIGTGTTAIYNYVRNNNYYSFIEQTRSLEQIEAKGWASFAEYAFSHRGVVCYYFAAITDLLFKQAGYDTRIVYGNGTHTTDHYWNQVLIDGKWLNFDTCNGFNGVDFSVLSAKTYTIYQYVNAKFY